VTDPGRPVLSTGVDGVAGGTVVSVEGDVPVDAESRFEVLVGRVEQPLRRALVAAYGSDAGREAAAEALAWAWEHLDRVERMDNPGGYLWRVGQTSVRRGRRWSDRRSDAPVPERAHEDDLPADPSLRTALDRLSPQQRAAVLLVHGWAYPLVDAAAAMGCSTSTLRNHLARGLARLQSELGEDPDA
jgi:DNA-directed RNA polymerase specialized sigma24 family protein